MTSRAIVNKINDKQVTVMSVRKGACGENCAMCGGCKGEEIFTVVNCDINVQIGDVVLIESNTFLVLFALCAVFLFPIVIPLAIYLLFYDINPIFAYTFTAFGVVFTLVFIWFLSKSKWFNNKITPKIISVLKKK